MQCNMLRFEGVIGQTPRAFQVTLIGVTVYLAVGPLGVAGARQGQEVLTSSAIVQPARNAAAD